MIRLRLAVPLFALALGAGVPARDGAQTTDARPSPAARTEEFRAEIGELARRSGFAAARAALETRAAAGGETAARARVQLGLLAHAHEEPELAVEMLAAAPDGDEALEDWRLYVLADAEAARGRLAEADGALATLLERLPDSPLRPRAILRRAEVAWQGGDAASALAGLAAARRERLPAPVALAVEKLGWSIGLARHDRTALAEAGRRLLAEFPLEASKLRVVDVVAAHGGPSDWRLWLSPAQLERRAEALLAIDFPASALTALAAVPPAERGLPWRLLEARALIAAERGAEALAHLSGTVAADPAEAARLAWTRAEAALEAATVRRGRATPPVATRERLRAEAREQLRAVVRSGVERDLAIAALKSLAADDLEQERLDDALATLRQLVALAPRETYGARPLFERGWRELERQNPTGAIGIFAELGELYSGQAIGRSAAYWSARAHERLGGAGNLERARTIYRSLAAADTRDFYARQAAERIARLARSEGAPAPEAAAVAREREAWPEDRALARARRLSDWGLDGLAATEIELVAERAEPAAAAALEALVAARRGDRRASLRLLKGAFPALGTAYQGSVPEAALELYYPLDYRETISEYARRGDLPAALVFGIVHQESGFDAAAKSRSGARGLMQIMPGTGREVARRLGLPFSTARLSDPDYSVRLGTTYFRQMLRTFDGNVELALAGYNGGPGRIARLWRAHGPDPELDRFLEGLALEEPRNYVKRILVLSESYRSRYPELG